VGSGHGPTATPVGHQDTTDEWRSQEVQEGKQVERLDQRLKDRQGSQHAPNPSANSTSLRLLIRLDDVGMTPMRVSVAGSLLNAWAHHGGRISGLCGHGRTRAHAVFERLSPASGSDSVPRWLSEKATDVEIVESGDGDEVRQKCTKAGLQTWRTGKMATPKAQRRDGRCTSHYHGPARLQLAIKPLHFAHWKCERMPPGSCALNGVSLPTAGSGSVVPGRGARIQTNGAFGLVERERKKMARRFSPGRR